MNHGDQTAQVQQNVEKTAGAQPTERVDLARRGSLAWLSVLALASVGAAKPYSKPRFVDEAEMEPEPGSRIR